MADYQLYATSALGGYDHDFGETGLKEVDGLGIVSVAVPLGGRDALAKAVRSAYGCGLPKPTVSVLSKGKSARLVSTQADQFFVLFDHAEPDAAEQVAERLGEAGYYTDQSDNWLALELSGAAARRALQRLCQVDTDPDVFKVNASARTVMHHLGALVIRTGEDRYLLLSARSSALSFLHAVETAVESVT